jgi:hypothetical protein
MSTGSIRPSGTGFARKVGYEFPPALAGLPMTRLHGPATANSGLAMLELLGFISYLITLYTYIVIRRHQRL